MTPHRDQAGSQPRLGTAASRSSARLLVMRRRQRLPGWEEPRRGARSQAMRPLFSVAEGGSAHDAEVPPGAEDVHDPDHRAVQVRLPSPRPVPAELQAHLISRMQLREEGPSSILQGAPLPDNICLPRLEADGWQQARARVAYKHHVLFYMR